MANSDLYSRGYVLSYPEGDSSLEREKIQYISDPGDRLHIVVEGETLTMLSTRFYGEPKFWYLIADCNQIVYGILYS